MPQFDRLTTPIEKLNGLSLEAAAGAETLGEAIPLKGVLDVCWVITATAFTSGSFTFKIQISPDGTTFTDATKGVVQGVVSSIVAVDAPASIGLCANEDEDTTHARLVVVGADTPVADITAIALLCNDNR